VGELAIQQADHMAPWGKGSTLFIDLILGGQITNHPIGDELAKLIEDDRTVLGWFGFVHTRFPWSEASRSQPLFNFLAHSCGMTVKTLLIKLDSYTTSKKVCTFWRFNPGVKPVTTNAVASGFTPRLLEKRFGANLSRIGIIPLRKMFDTISHSSLFLAAT